MFESGRSRKTELPRAVRGTANLMSQAMRWWLASHPLSCIGHRLAILVHKGSDPTLPYQALVTRESARLFYRVRPLGT